MAAIVISFLSVSFGFVTFRQATLQDTDWNWTWKDVVVDMVWNIMSISSRVIALTLFASYEVHWFWSIAGTHTVFMIGVSYFLERGDNSRDAAKVCVHMGGAAWMGFGSLFNFCADSGQPKRFYFMYWLIMFIENTTMISLWYQWTIGLGLWYHDAALVFVIVVHLLSLVVECLHAYFYNDRKKKNRNM